MSLTMPRRALLPWMLICGALALGAPRALVAQPAGAGDLSSLFPSEAPVELRSGPGLVRLPLPAAVLETTRTDLIDLRLFDGRGQEVPFAVDSATRPLSPRRTVSLSVEVEPSEVEQQRVRSDGGTRLYAERLVVAVPERPSPTGAWEIELHTERPHFVRQLRIRAPESEREPLVSTTIFRLPDPLRERLRIALPAELPERLEIELRGERGYLEPVVRFEAARVAKAEQFAVRLTELARRRVGERTKLELARPAGIVPERLRVVTTTTTFHRPVVVRDLGTAGKGRELARGELYRVRDPYEVDHRSIALARARGDRLEVILDDGGSPPLEELAFEAVVDRPSLVFDDQGHPAPLWLRFGGGRAQAPGYDLQRLAQDGLGRRALDQSAVRDGSVGPVRVNPRFDRKPALSFMMRPGPPVVISEFSHRRGFQIVEVGEGVSRLSLGPHELAHARADLADLRIVDLQGRQWPYLLEQGARDSVVVSVGPPQSSGGTSRYSLRPAAEPLPICDLELETAAAYVGRKASLLARDPGAKERVLWSGTLRRRPGKSDELVLNVDADGIRAEGLVLAVDDGDDPPLQIRKAIATIATAELFVVAPAGRYQLLVGKADTPFPRYELRAARELVLAVRSSSIAAGTLEPNPGFHPPPKKGGTSVWLLWAVIVLAVVVLGWLTARLVRREAEGVPDSRAPASSRRDEGSPERSDRGEAAAEAPTGDEPSEAPASDPPSDEA